MEESDKESRMDVLPTGVYQHSQGAGCRKTVEIASKANRHRHIIHNKFYLEVKTIIQDTKLSPVS